MAPSRNKPAARDVSGILLVDKPSGMTSNRALQRVKRLFGASKAGHTGSLDPLATGMLPICLGQATKVSAYLLEAGKRYFVRGRFGIATDSGDADGSVVERRETEPVDEAELAAASAGLTGRIQQVPPMYSALKHGGRRLYELARRGLEVDRAARPVEVYELVIERYRWPDFELYVSCSKGTYIRSLVMDLAAALGTCGHVRALRRLSVDPFGDEPMHTLDALEQTATAGPTALDALLLPAERALQDWPSVELDPEMAARLLHGQQIPAVPAWRSGPVRLFGPDRRFLGIGEVDSDGRLSPRRLFTPRRLGDG